MRLLFIFYNCVNLIHKLQVNYVLSLNIQLNIINSKITNKATTIIIMNI